MQVERDRDRGFRCGRTDFFQQRAFTIHGAVFHHHGTVQVKKDCVAACGGLGADQVAETVIGVAVDRTGRVGEACHRGDDFGFFIFRQVDESADGCARAFHRAEGILAQIGALGTEGLPWRGNGRERIGLVFHLCDEDFHFIQLMLEVLKGINHQAHQVRQENRKIPLGFRCVLADKGAKTRLYDSFRCRRQTRKMSHVLSCSTRQCRLCSCPW